MNKNTDIIERQDKQEQNENDISMLSTGTMMHVDKSQIDEADGDALNFLHHNNDDDDNNIDIRNGALDQGFDFEDNNNVESGNKKNRQVHVVDNASNNNTASSSFVADYGSDSSAFASNKDPFKLLHASTKVEDIISTAEALNYTVDDDKSKAGRRRITFKSDNFTTRKYNVVVRKTTNEKGFQLILVFYGTRSLDKFFGVGKDVFFNALKGAQPASEDDDHDSDTKDFLGCIWKIHKVDRGVSPTPRSEYTF